MSIVDPIFHHEFKDKSLIKLALTHRSASGLNNERLEFLGDSILSAIISEELIQKFPRAKEGQLTKMRASLVNGKKLSELAIGTNIDKHLILGEGEKKSGGWRRVSILSNVFEAILGAIFLDSSYQTCKILVCKCFQTSLEDLKRRPILRDPKTRLQEILQSRGLGLPIYTVKSIEGKDHEKIFTVSCDTELSSPQTGKGDSKRVAEQRAAEATLCMLK